MVEGKVEALGSQLRDAQQVKSREAMDAIFDAGCLCQWAGDPDEPTVPGVYESTWSVLDEIDDTCPVHGASAPAARPREDDRVTGAAGDCAHGVPLHLLCGACEPEVAARQAEGWAKVALEGQQHPGPAVMHDMAAILGERGSRYGAFLPNARISQALKQVMADSPNWLMMRDDQREALELIALKISRILSGDPDYADNWVDIAGYAQLVADELVRRSSPAAPGGLSRPQADAA